jgi:hypothetical protein
MAKFNLRSYPQNQKEAPVEDTPFEPHNWIYVDVPFSEDALDDLHKISEKSGASPVRVLRTIVEEYQRNGTPPQLATSDASPIYRRVPLTHQLLRNINEIAAEKRMRPITALQSILEAELHRRAPNP